LTPPWGHREDAGGIPAGEGAGISPRKGLRRSFASDPRGLALIGLVALLLLVVAWAATGIGGADPQADAVTANPALNATAEAIVAAAWGASIVVMFVLLRRLRRRLEEDVETLGLPEEPTPRWVKVVAWLIVAAVFVVPLLFLTNGDDRQPQAQPSVETAPGDRTDDASGRTTPSPWLISGFVVGAAVAAFAFAARRSSSIAVDREPLPELLAKVVEVVDDSIRDIEGEPDARRAIIRAYARMERALARSGVPRRPSETPFEYIERVLRHLMVPGEPARSLTELFEIARFSDRPIDLSMKQRAIDCLLDIRSGLTSEVT
jgi:Domain of unknown function (DUF4129)